MRMLDAVRLVLVRSESLREALVRLGCSPAKIRIQRTGIPLDDFAFQTRSWPTDGTWKFLQACRLISKKGLQTSLRAFAHFAREFPRAHFTIAGEGPLLPDLQKSAADLRIADRVTFTGFVTQPELRELFYRSHIFLHPSETAADGNQEGVPNSMLEAMATGLPVFATTHGGIPEAIDHSVSGILVAERDADALAHALLTAAADLEMLSRIAKRGADSVAEKFERRAQVAQLEQHYFDAITAS